MTENTNYIIRKTRSALIWNRLLIVPLLAIYNFAPFILYKDLGGTPLHLMFLIALKPVGALFSLYWSAAVAKRQDRLIPNIFWSGILAHLPFLFFPWVNSPWYLVFAAGVYWTLSRGGIPAWMEVVKQNLPSEKRSRLFSRSLALGYLKGMILAIVMGVMLDQHSAAWRWIFPISALIGMVGVVLQSRVPLRPAEEATSTQKLRFHRRDLVHPWSKAWDLIRSRPDFSRFQLGFMICGGAMIILQPALPIFFVDVLGITYTEIACALSICKGLGFASTSPLWGKWLPRANVFHFSMLIFLLVALFPAFLISSQVQIVWLYIAYLFYGIAQAGSELIWHMSGPLFSREQESSRYSSVNVMTVGLRGAIAPLVGSFLCTVAGPIAVFLFSILLCGWSSTLMHRWSPYHKKTNIPEVI